VLQSKPDQRPEARVLQSKPRHMQPHTGTHADIASGALLALSLLGNVGALTVIALLSIFALMLSAASNMSFVYEPQLLATELQASGTGLAIVAKRIDSAAARCSPPVVPTEAGAPVALGA
jgi:putative MFS transporter